MTLRYVVPMSKDDRVGELKDYLRFIVESGGSGVATLSLKDCELLLEELK